MPATRVWLFLAASAFALTAVAGSLLLYLDPSPMGAGSIGLALLFSLLCLHLGTRAPQPTLAASQSGAAAPDGCAACGARRDPTLGFCARCGA